MSDFDLKLILERQVEALKTFAASTRKQVEKIESRAASTGDPKP